MSYPLQGLKVLDMSRVLAGPFAGRMLSDLGADVVKLEPPEGDVTRLWGRKIGGISGYFNQQNVGKRGVCVDLRAEAGVELVRRLAAQADILIENFRPDVMGRLGLSWARLSQENPRLIMLSISGFGGGGSEERRAAYAPIIHAEAGLVARQAKRSQGQPVDLVLSVADTNASLHGLVGLLAALHQRHATGSGQQVEIAMIDASLATDDQIHHELDRAGETRGGDGVSLAQAGIAEVWQTGAGEVMIAGDLKYLSRQLSKVMGIEDPAAPDMPLQEKMRLRRASVQAFFDGLDRPGLIDALNRMNVAWGDVRKGVEVLSQPTVLERGTLVEVDDRAGGTRRVPRAPYRFSDAECGVHAGAARRGEHNGEVLQEWLGLADADVAGFEQQGVLLHANEEDEED